MEPIDYCSVLAGPNTDTQARYRPLCGGISAAHYLVGAGTLGAIVRDARTGEPLLLSNNHTFANMSTVVDKRARKGDPILQPSCYSDDTRILTKTGLKYFCELNYSDEICTLNPTTGFIEYQLPSRIISSSYSGDMVLFEGQMYNLLVTPNHQLVIQRTYSENQRGFSPEFITAEEIYNGVREKYNEVIQLQKTLGNKHTEISKIVGMSRHTIKGWINGSKKPCISNNCLQFIKTGLWEGRNLEQFTIPTVTGLKNNRTKGIIKFDMATWLSFFGWYLSEGSLGGPYQESIGNYKISIRQFKYDINKIADIIRMLGFNPYVRLEHGSIEFYSKELHYYLKQFGYAKDKFIPWEIKQLPPEKLKILLDSLYKGDGSFVRVRADKYNDTYLGNPGVYATISPQLADDVAEIALKCGYGVSIQQNESYASELMTSRGTPEGTRYNDIYHVGLSSRNLTPRITNKPTVVDYTGDVYCVTVPNHIVMVERKGKFTWSGNSADGGKYPEDIVAYLERWIPFDPIYNNIVDAAVARPVPGVMSDDMILSEGSGSEFIIPEGATACTRGAVKKFGRTGGKTTGRVVDCNFATTIPYPSGVTVHYIDQILIQIDTCAGDSGAIYLNDNDKVIGLHCGGAIINGVRYAVANKIENVCRLLGIVI